MIGVTIGIGPGWKEVAQRAADRMAEKTGLKCHILDSWHGEPYEHPAWVKCRIIDLFPQEDSFFYFDSDIWCLKPWSPEHLFSGFNRDFLAVPAIDNKYLRDECHRYDIPENGKYVCTGLMIFGREHKAVFEYAESLHPNFGLWYDQTPINVALKNQGIFISQLPHKFCSETHGGNYSPAFTGVPIMEVVNLHFCSCGGDASRVAALQKGGINL